MAGVSLDRGKRELSGSGVMASVTFSGTPKPGDRVTVGYRYLDKKGNTVEQGWEEIELAPAGAADAPARASFAVAPNPVSAAGSRRACTLRHDASALRSVAASGAGGVFVVTVPAASADGRAPVSLAVFSAAGARVLSCGADALRDVAAVQDASYLLHIYWDGRDQAGNLLEPGVYTAVVQVGGGAGAFRMKASVGIVR